MDISTIARELLDKVLQETVARFQNNNTYHDTYRLNLTDQGGLHLECLEAGMEITYKRERLLRDSEMLATNILESWSSLEDTDQQKLMPIFEIALKVGIQTMIDWCLNENVFSDTTKARSFFLGLASALTFADLGKARLLARFPTTKIVTPTSKTELSMEEAIQRVADSTFEEITERKRAYLQETASSIGKLKKEQFAPTSDDLFPICQDAKALYLAYKQENWREIIKEKYGTFPDDLLERFTDPVETRQGEPGAMSKLWALRLCGIGAEMGRAALFKLYQESRNLQG